MFNRWLQVGARQRLVEAEEALRLQLRANRARRGAAEDAVAALKREKLWAPRTAAPPPCPYSAYPDARSTFRVLRPCKVARTRTRDQRACCVPVK